MLTPAILLEMAVTFEDRSRDPACLYEQRLDARRDRDMAIACAAYLERKGITEIKTIGPFGNLPVTKGTKIRIKKGAEITHMGKGRVVAGKTYVVEAFDSCPGHAWHTFAEEWEVRNQTISWVGAGSYWNYIDANDVEIVQ